MGRIVQKQFDEFHNEIKLSHIDDNKYLVEKRNMLIKEIRNFLKKEYPDAKERPKFTWFNQGSYYMGTGIKPLNDNQDFDIDVGLLFHFSIDCYEPVKIKQIVHDALDKCFPRDVDIMKPCVRVQYRKGDQPNYHVDFAIYSSGDYNSDGYTYLAKGCPGSQAENKFWELANPDLLKDKVDNLFSDSEEEDQFKRNIRYLKRWKDNNFPSEGNQSPTGIALTALAMNLFKPYVKNIFSSEEDINDLKALKELVTGIINQFDTNGNISVNLPVEPYNNLFEKFTDIGMDNFKVKLEDLKKSLDTAINHEAEMNYIEACKELAKKFGDDFPVSTEEQLAKKQKAPAIACSTESA